MPRTEVPFYRDANDHGSNVAILAHSLTKEDVVPPNDIARALTRKKAFEANPEQHTYKE